MGIQARVRARVIDTVLGPRVAKARRALLSPRREIELYYEVGDPYSHLLTQLLPSIESASGLPVRVLPVPPPDAAFDPEPELRTQHAISDAKLLSEAFGLSFSAESERTQVHRDLANAALTAATAPQAPLAHAREVGSAFWGGDRDGLERLAGGAHSSRADSILAKNHRRRRAGGHYLGGMLRHRGVWYWGVDRLWHLVCDLQRDGHSVSSPLEFRSSTVIETPAELEMFFSFRSPYAYLGVVRARRLAEALGIPLIVRPVLPAVMRGLSIPRAKQLYIARDVAREARKFGIPFGRICDPLGPGIYRCLVAFDCATSDHQAAALACSIAQGIWSEAKDVTTDEDLAELVERAGVSATRVAEALASAPAQAAATARAESNRKALYGLGQWGVPTVRAGDFVVWGNDRLSLLARRLGLTDTRWG